MKMKSFSGYVIVVLLIQLIALSSCKEKENESPVAEITSPVDGTMVMPGDRITVTASAEDPDGSIVEVKLYLDYTYVAVFTEPPYEYLWEIGDSLYGDVEVRVTAVDNESAANSDEIVVTVDADGGFNPDLSYGEMSDIDGNSYKTILLGDQNWMAENLKVTHYADGSAIPFVGDDGLWSELGESGKAYCWYDNMSEYGDTTGALYSWSASLDVCPEGWHLPSDEEWKELEFHLGMSEEYVNKHEWRGTYEGGMLKERGFSNWNNPNIAATNASGFTALPGGYRSNTGGFYGFGMYAAYWTSTEKEETNTIWYRALSHENTDVYRYWVEGNRGASVRCVED